MPSDPWNKRMLFARVDAGQGFRREERVGCGLKKQDLRQQKQGDGGSAWECLDQLATSKRKRLYIYQDEDNIVASCSCSIHTDKRESRLLWVRRLFRPSWHPDFSGRHPAFQINRELLLSPACPVSTLTRPFPPSAFTHSLAHSLPPPPSPLSAPNHPLHSGSHGSLILLSSRTVS